MTKKLVFAIICFMSLFRLRSESKVSANVCDPTSEDFDMFADVDFQTKEIDHTRSGMDLFDRAFFALPNAVTSVVSTGLEYIVPEQDDREVPSFSRRRVFGIIAGTLAVVSIGVWGVRGQLAAEDRVKKVEECVEDKLGGINIDLRINPETGKIARPRAIYKEIVDCEDEVTQD